MNELQIFNNEEFGEIRTVTIKDETWFVGRDVATALGYAKPENAIATHVSDEDKTSTLIQGSGSNYKSTVTNPDGSIRTTKTPKVTGRGQVYFINKFVKEKRQ